MSDKKRSAIRYSKEKNHSECIFACSFSYLGLNHVAVKLEYITLFNVKCFYYMCNEFNFPNKITTIIKQECFATFSVVQKKYLECITL